MRIDGSRAKLGCRIVYRSFILSARSFNGTRISVSFFASLLRQLREDMTRVNGVQNWPTRQVKRREKAKTWKNVGKRDDNRPAIVIIASLLRTCFENEDPVEHRLSRWPVAQWKALEYLLYLLFNHRAMGVLFSLRSSTTFSRKRYVPPTVISVINGPPLTTRFIYL